MEEKTKQKKLSVYELIHHFCNNTINNEYIIGDWYFSPTEVLYNKTKVAEIRTVNNTYLILLNAKFDNGGRFRNNINCHTFERSIPSNKSFYKCYTKIPHEITVEWAIKEFEECNKEYFSSIAKLKEFVKDRKQYFYAKEKDTKVFNLYNLFTNKTDYLDRILKVEAYPKYYKGWGQIYYGNKIVIEQTIREFLSKGTFDYITPEEKEIYDFKLWRNEYGRIIDGSLANQFKHTKKEAFEIFKNKERRKLVEENVKEQIEKLRIEKTKKELEKKQKEIEKIEEKILNFRKTLLISSSSALKYQVLSFNGNFIKTSLSVTISIEEAKKALQLFRLFKDKGYTSFVEKDIKISVFSLICIKPMKHIKIVDKKEVIIESPTIIIGCHTIPYFEVEDFINYYKLDW